MKYSNDLTKLIPVVFTRFDFDDVELHVAFDTSDEWLMVIWNVLISHSAYSQFLSSSPFYVPALFHKLVRMVKALWLAFLELNLIMESDVKSVNEENKEVIAAFKDKNVTAADRKVVIPTLKYFNNEEMKKFTDDPDKLIKVLLPRYDSSTAPFPILLDTSNEWHIAFWKLLTAHSAYSNFLKLDQDFVISIFLKLARIMEAIWLNFFGVNTNVEASIHPIHEENREIVELLKIELISPVEHKDFDPAIKYFVTWFKSVNSNALKAHFKSKTSKKPNHRTWDIAHCHAFAIVGSQSLNDEDKQADGQDGDIFADFDDHDFTLPPKDVPFEPIKVAEIEPAAEGIEKKEEDEHAENLEMNIDMKNLIEVAEYHKRHGSSFNNIYKIQKINNHRVDAEGNLLVKGVVRPQRTNPIKCKNCTASLCSLRRNLDGWVQCTDSECLRFYHFECLDEINKDRCFCFGELFACTFCFPSLQPVPAEE